MTFIKTFFARSAESCLDKLCGENEECVEDSNGNPKCICKLCSDEPSEEVCGSDGITYFSLCHLQRASCTQKQSDLYAHHYGPCGELTVVRDCRNEMMAFPFTMDLVVMYEYFDLSRIKKVSSTLAGVGVSGVDFPCFGDHQYDVP